MRQAQVIFYTNRQGFQFVAEVAMEKSYALQRCQTLQSEHPYNTYTVKPFPLDVGIEHPFSVTFNTYDQEWSAKQLRPIEPEMGEEPPNKKEIAPHEVYSERWVWPLIWADSPESAIRKASKEAIKVLSPNRGEPEL